MNINISDEIRTPLPHFKVLKIEAEVENSPTSDRLWEELQQEVQTWASKLELPDINRRPAIAATRAAYKALGKEPNRYRPSAEALSRRVVKGVGLYRINALVDIINLISLRSGYSIGGFDLDKIEGDTITLGVGREGEPFEAIGRGMLNIAGLPVYRDSIGGIGTPTSDNERTKLSIDTRRLLMTVNCYGEEMPLDEVERLTYSLLRDHCNLKSFTASYHHA